MHLLILLYVSIVLGFSSNNTLENRNTNNSSCFTVFIPSTAFKDYIDFFVRTFPSLTLKTKLYSSWFRLIIFVHFSFLTPDNIEPQCT